MVKYIHPHDKKVSGIVISGEALDIVYTNIYTKTDEEVLKSVKKTSESIKNILNRLNICENL